MTDANSVWNLTSDQWRRLAERSQAANDALEDGAYVRHDPAADELHFYATPLSKPAGWRYPFLEPVSGVRQPGAFVGRAWHDDQTGFVDFEVILYAAAQALRADYESDVSDLDYVTYEQAVEQAVQGTDADLAWLRQEFGRLANLTFHL
jgi:hypothetical protein